MMDQPQEQVQDGPAGGDMDIDAMFAQEFGELQGLLENMTEVAEGQQTAADDQAVEGAAGGGAAEGGGGYEDDDGGDDMPLDDDGGVAEDAGGGAGGEADAAAAGSGALTAADLAARAEPEEERAERILASLTEAQQDRYAAFRRSGLPRPKMKKFFQQLMSVVPTDKTLIALCGIGEMFVGDLVEIGFEDFKTMKTDGDLQVLERELQDLVGKYENPVNKAAKGLMGKFTEIVQGKKELVSDTQKKPWIMW